MGQGAPVLKFLASPAGRRAASGNRCLGGGTKDPKGGTGQKGPGRKAVANTLSALKHRLPDDTGPLRLALPLCMEFSLAGAAASPSACETFGNLANQCRSHCVPPMGTNFPLPPVASQHETRGRSLTAAGGSPKTQPLPRGCHLNPQGLSYLPSRDQTRCGAWPLRSWPSGHSSQSSPLDEEATSPRILRLPAPCWEGSETSTFLQE